MTNLSERILHLLSENEPLDTLHLSTILKEDHQKIVGAVKSLQIIDNLIIVEQQSRKTWELTNEGSQVSENG